MEKKEDKVGDRIIPVEAGKVIPMTKEEWKKFQKQMKVERDYFYMIGNKKYIHYEDEDYVRVSDIEQELDKAREEGKGGVLEIFTEEELRVLRFALKVNREGIHTIWDEDTFDTIWKKVGGLPKLKQ